MKKFFTNLHKRLPKHRIMMSSKNDKLPHIVWDLKNLDSVNQDKRKPEKLRDKLAYTSVKTARYLFDKITNYDEKEMTPNKWIN